METKKTTRQELINKLESPQYKAKYKALSVAKLLFSQDSNREYFSSKRKRNNITFVITTVGRFRLNQILYLLQILYFLEYGEFLFSDGLYAWESGVIVYKVHTHFWELHKGMNMEKIKDIEDEETKEFIVGYYNYLKTLSDRTLWEFSYNDLAWSKTWTESSQPYIDITDEKNISFYREYCSPWLQAVKC